MSNLMQSIDERTTLAGNNRLEVLLFSLGKNKDTQTDELFGINVFKIREVIPVPKITRSPKMPFAVEGMTSIRGSIIPIVDLAKFCNIDTNDKPEILIVTEFNKHTQGFLVKSVDNIARLKWSDVKTPPEMTMRNHQGLVTAITHMKDDRIAMIVDVEKILSETSNFAESDKFYNDVIKLEDKSKTILFADDSSVARNQINRTLTEMGINKIETINGAEAWNKLIELADKAETNNTPISDYVGAVLTDVEMPEMDGYVLTKNIKSDPRFTGLPVIMHSSLSAKANMSLGKGVGADAYVAKFEPNELSQKIADILSIGRNIDLKKAS